MEKQADFIREFADKIFKQAATGLAYMNASGWIHRDVKPDNILVNGLGEVRIIEMKTTETKEPPHRGSCMERMSSRRVSAGGDDALT